MVRQYIPLHLGAFMVLTAAAADGERGRDSAANETSPREEPSP